MRLQYAEDVRLAHNTRRACTRSIPKILQAAANGGSKDEKHGLTKIRDVLKTSSS